MHRRKGWKRLSSGHLGKRRQKKAQAQKEQAGRTPGEETSSDEANYGSAAAFSTAISSWGFDSPKLSKKPVHLNIDGTIASEWGERSKNFDKFYDPEFWQGPWYGKA